MDAGHRLVRHPRVSGVTLEVAVQADPVHLSAFGHLLLADDRDIVLGLARHHAGVATDAGVQIDGHAPGMAGVLLLLPERDERRMVDALMLDEVGVLSVVR